MIHSINTDFLYKPKPEQPGQSFNNEGWGHLDPSDLDIIDAFNDVGNIVRPKEILEIGMFCGHSTVLMLELWEDAFIHSMDGNHCAVESAKEISKRWPDRFEFIPHYTKNGYSNIPIEAAPIDLVFIDGGHKRENVMVDWRIAEKLQAKYVLFDNVEQPGVMQALTSLRLFDIKCQPRYYFYTQTHKNQRKPGILMLIKR